MKFKLFLAAIVIFSSLQTKVYAQLSMSAPNPILYNDPIPAAKDIPYPGTLTVAVDATDTARGIFHVREIVPVEKPGPFTLLYPKWLPGHHDPSGAIVAVAGLVFTANGHTLAWVRDPVDVFAFTVNVPLGVTQIEINFEFLSPTSPKEGRVVMTPICSICSGSQPRSTQQAISRDAFQS